MAVNTVYSPDFDHWVGTWSTLGRSRHPPLSMTTDAGVSTVRDTDNRYRMLIPSALLYEGGAPGSYLVPCMENDPKQNQAKISRKERVRKGSLLWVWPHLK